MARGRALVEDVLPVLEARLTPAIDAYAAGRFAEMVQRYGDAIARERERMERLG
jgi:hypothetical protein